MVSAGSEVPNFVDAHDLAGTRGTSSCQRRPAAAVAVALLSCLLLQGCGTSETKGMSEADPVMSRASLTGGESVVPRGARTASATRDSFADRYPRDSFSDRYAALGLASQTAPEVVFAPQSSHV